MSARSARGTFPAFRHEAPNLAPQVIDRRRLLEVMAGRYDRRLTVITARGGFGKTTLLTQAVLANLAAPVGVDAWLRLEPADRDPDHLLTGLARSLTGPGDERAAVGVADITEMVWHLAPMPVALILDDIHEIVGATGSWTAVRSLLDQLPHNASLVLAGRVPPSLPVSRLRAAGEAAVIDEAALAFNGAELEAFGRARSVSDDLLQILPPWPAAAVLTAATGLDAGTDYLWREVLSNMEPLRLELLARVALFDVVDDIVVGALQPDPSWTAERLMDGLPLVDADRLGTFRMHAMWADALDDLLTERARRQALLAGAEALLAQRHHRRAAEAFARADDLDGLHRAVRIFATQPIAAVTIPDVAALFELLPDHQRDGPLGRYLAAARLWSGHQRDAAARFEDAMCCAVEHGDAEVESLARWRLVQLRYLDDHRLLTVDRRMEELAAAGVPLGSSSVAFVRSVQAQNDGRVDDALAAIEDLDGFDPGQRLTAMMSRLIDLGRPEAISATLESVLGPDGIDLFGAQAIWLRGDVDPETAWAISRQLPGIAGRSGVLNEQVTLRCIIATIALAAGEFVEAEALVAQTRDWFGLGGLQVQLLTLVAEALVALHTEGEAAACEKLEEALATVPLGRWPTRAYLHGLASIRGLVPGTEVLDECALGPSLRVAVAAGRALVRARHGDLDAGAELPWDTPNLLRCQVPAPLLAELALVRSMHRDPSGDRARALLDQIPQRRIWLQRIAESGHPAAAAAGTLLGTMPDRPSYDLRVHALGPLQIERSDGTTVDPVWESRERVREILIRLLLERRVSRAELAASVWPDSPPAKAAGNLRTNLRHLHQALQPDRPVDAPTWFVRVDATTVQLTDDGIEVDVDRFDALVDTALRAEASGMPSVALAEYQSAAELYRGDLLEGVDDPDIELERLRLRSVALGIACRRAELILARGEPETAMRLAGEALTLDPLSERAHRVVIRCHLALGSSSAARVSANRLIEELAREGLSPDDETLLLLRRLEP